MADETVNLGEPTEEPAKDPGNSSPEAWTALMTEDEQAEMRELLNADSATDEAEGEVA